MNLKVWGIFVLRVVVGIVFIAHGWAKLQGMEGTIGFFGSLGLAPFLAYVVAYVEFIGGLTLVLGFYSRLAGYLLAVVMAYVVLFVKMKGGFLGGYEYELVLFAALLAISWSGSGPYSVSGKVCGCGNCGMCGMKVFGKGNTQNPSM